MISNVGSSKSVSSCAGASRIDEEHKQIIRRLYMVYGIRSTGSKSTDKALLRSKELEEARNSKSVNTSLLTVSVKEQEKIIEKEEEKKAATEIQFNPNEMLGQKLLGEQNMVAINMQKKKSNKIQA